MKGRREEEEPELELRVGRQHLMGPASHSLEVGPPPNYEYLLWARAQVPGALGGTSTGISRAFHGRTGVTRAQFSIYLPAGRQINLMAP